MGLTIWSSILINKICWSASALMKMHGTQFKKVGHRMIREKNLKHKLM